MWAGDSGYRLQSAGKRGGQYRWTVIEQGFEGKNQDRGWRRARMRFQTRWLMGCFSNRLPLLCPCPCPSCFRIHNHQLFASILFKPIRTQSFWEKVIGRRRWTSGGAETSTRGCDDAGMGERPGAWRYRRHEYSSMRPRGERGRCLSRVRIGRGRGCVCGRGVSGSVSAMSSK